MQARRIAFPPDTNSFTTVTINTNTTTTTTTTTSHSFIPLASSVTHPPPSTPSGSLVGVTSDSECEDKKSSASSTGAADAGRAFSSASPQTGASLVTSHDYNMEQSNVALLRAELK
ncbi:hypothetical protein Pmani_037180, partial [Petrolisthes manimaculis]